MDREKYKHSSLCIDMGCFWSETAIRAYWQICWNIKNKKIIFYFTLYINQAYNVRKNSKNTGKVLYFQITLKIKFCSERCTVCIPILKAKSLKANAEKEAKGPSALWWQYVVSIHFRTLFLIKSSQLYYKEILRRWGNTPKNIYS